MSEQYPPDVYVDGGPAPAHTSANDLRQFEQDRKTPLPVDATEIDYDDEMWEHEREHALEESDYECQACGAPVEERDLYVQYYTNPEGAVMEPQFAWGVQNMVVWCEECAGDRAPRNPRHKVTSRHDSTSGSTTVKSWVGGFAESLKAWYGEVGRRMAWRAGQAAFGAGVLAALVLAMVGVAGVATSEFSVVVGAVSGVTAVVLASVLGGVWMRTRLFDADARELWVEGELYSQYPREPVDYVFKALVRRNPLHIEDPGRGDGRGRGRGHSEGRGRWP